jgi:hypothetical protein
MFRERGNTKILKTKILVRIDQKLPKKSDLNFFKKNKIKTETKKEKEKKYI